jgi:hypothetical protein
MAGLRGIFRTFVERNNEPAAELLFWLNGLIAAAAGIVLWLRFDVPFGGAAAVSTAGFVVLFFSLLHPYSAIVAATIGSLASGGIGALVGASFGLRYAGTTGAWAGAFVAGAGFLAVAVSSYRKLVRAGLVARSRRPGASP